MPETTHAHILLSLDELKSAVSDLIRKVEEQGAQIAETREIVQAWGSVKTGGRFVIGLGKVVAGAGAIYAGAGAIYLFFKHVMGAIR